MTSFIANCPADATYIVFGKPCWEASPSTWTDLPGAKIDLSVGQGTTSYGAVFVATFSAKALAEATPDNGVVSATVFFGGQQAEPSSTNHCFATCHGNPKWSSHTLICTFRFDPRFNVRDVSVQVKILASSGTKAGIQNWVLKVERFNL
ncbi:hypothetical protein L208DRAFT_1396297 [Tricholoma matsutake]|nr:hypothetical protein L208DRAFT_1396297 [Tricholoma matsutake 945]